MNSPVSLSVVRTGLPLLPQLLVHERAEGRPQEDAAGGDHGRAEGGLPVDVMCVGGGELWVYVSMSVRPANLN